MSYFDDFFFVFDTKIKASKTIDWLQFTYNNQIPLLRLSQNCLLEKSKKFYELLSIVIVVVKIKTEKYFRQRGEGRMG